MPEERRRPSPSRSDIPEDTLGPAGETNTEEAGRMSVRLSRFFGPAQGPGELGRLGGLRVLKLLGAGAMGAVFKAEDPDLARLVAVKVIKPELAILPEARERFFTEAKAAGALANDHVMPVYRIGEENGLPFIVMPMLPGETLEKRLVREPLPPPAWAARVTAEAADGLAAAHAAGLIHRDVKPDNLWLEAPRDRVKLLDFGLARRVSGGIRTTLPGNLIGTPAYMSPEQVTGQEVTDRADVFSLGVVLYRMLTATQPFVRDDLPQTLAAVATEPPPPAREVNPAVPAELSAIAERLLTPDPRLRPSATEAAELLQSYLLTLSVPPTPAPPPPPPGPPWWRWLLVPIGLLLVALFAVVVWLMVHVPAPTLISTQRIEVTRLGSPPPAPTFPTTRPEPSRPTPPPTRFAPPPRTSPRPVSPTRPVSVVVRPRVRRPGERLVNAVGMEFAWCPLGTFLMGSPTDEPGRDVPPQGADETQHPVTLSHGFFLGKTEVTQRQWRDVMGDNPSGFRGDDLPVENVSWAAAGEFCRRLSERPEERRMHRRYRLPTEAEWEYACRAGTQTAFARGPELTADLANCDDTVPYARGPRGQYRERTEKVGRFLANAWGLYDLHGNVWEWVADGYAPYPRGPVTDPFEGNGDGRRILRGGSWINGPRQCRAAKRLFVKPSFVGKNIVGLRVVCEGE